MAAGGSLSQMVVPPFIAFMQSHYNPRTALLMTSVLILHVCFAAALLPADPKNNAPLQVDYLAVLRRRDVAFQCLVTGLVNATLALSAATVPQALLDTGHSSHEVALYTSVTGMATLAVRLMVGLFLCYCYQPVLVVRLACTLSAATIPGECPPHYPFSHPLHKNCLNPTGYLTEHHVTVWYWSERLTWRAAWLSVSGASSGITFGLTGLVILEVAGLRWQAEALSFVYLSTGIATLLFGQLVGVYTERTMSILITQ